MHPKAALGPPLFVGQASLSDEKDCCQIDNWSTGQVKVSYRIQRYEAVFESAIFRLFLPLLRAVGDYDRF
jgi:hypothetical protein